MTLINTDNCKVFFLPVNKNPNLCLLRSIYYQTRLTYYFIFFTAINALVLDIHVSKYNNITENENENILYIYSVFKSIQQYNVNAGHCEAQGRRVFKGLDKI